MSGGCAGVLDPAGRVEGLVAEALEGALFKLFCISSRPSRVLARKREVEELLEDVVCPIFACWKHPLATGSLDRVQAW